MTPEEAKAVVGAAGQQLRYEWKTTHKVLAAIPERERDYKPDPNSRSAWDLALHIAGADIWFLDCILAGQFGEPGSGPPADNVASLAEWYAQAFPARLERVMALDGAQAAAILDFYGMKLSAAHLVMFTLVHMVHHRGQLATYLRPMGGKVPSIYGSSFDEQWQRPAKAGA